jgi:hypothetical protein
LLDQKNKAHQVYLARLTRTKKQNIRKKGSGRTLHAGRTKNR